MDKNYKLNKLEKNNFEITATIPWKEISENQDLVIKKAGNDLEIKGFRKGSAPASMVAETLGPTKVVEKTLNKILPEIYQKAIFEFQLKPIVAPKIEFVSVKEGEDWQIKFIACEEPKVELGNYKEEFQKNKDVSIWTPGKNEPTKEDSEKREKKLDKVISWLIDNVKVEISDLLTEEEVNHKLSGLLSETQKLGISVEQYLSSTGKTIDSLKAEYKLQATKNLQLEFILSKIAESENIIIEPEEVEKTISMAEEKDKPAMQQQKYSVAILLKQQKTLDFLANL